MACENTEDLSLDRLLKRLRKFRNELSELEALAKDDLNALEQRTVEVSDKAVLSKEDRPSPPLLVDCHGTLSNIESCGEEIRKILTYIHRDLYGAKEEKASMAPS